MIWQKLPEWTFLKRCSNFDTNYCKSSLNSPFKESWAGPSYTGVTNLLNVNMGYRGFKEREQGIRGTVEQGIRVSGERRNSGSEDHGNRGSEDQGIRGSEEEGI